MGYGVRGAMYLVVAVLCIAAYLVTSRSEMPDFDYTGKVDYVYDGDTFRMGELVFRLHGIDAPESEQLCKVRGVSWPCGREATWILDRRIRGKYVSCADTGRTDPYERIIGICYEDGTDLSAWLVDDGWAVAFRRYSSDYDEEEMRAKMARRGLWQGSFEMPELWRRARK